MNENRRIIAQSIWLHAHVCIHLGGLKKSHNVLEVDVIRKIPVPLSRRYAETRFQFIMALDHLSLAECSDSCSLMTSFFRELQRNEKIRVSRGDDISKKNLRNLMCFGI
jgi:hypothetical protein